MSLLYIIRETLLMMGFTFLVGIGFAYLLKLMTILFRGLTYENRTQALWRSRVWLRAYRIQTVCSYNFIHTLASHREFLGKLHLMNEMAEYHFGNRDADERKDSEMKCLYEMHHGKI